MQGARVTCRFHSGSSETLGSNIRGRNRRTRVSNDAHKLRISKAIKAAIEKPLKFYFAVPSIDLTNWVVVEAGNPEQPIGSVV
jgi:hypothetical protein